LAHDLFEYGQNSIDGKEEFARSSVYTVHKGAKCLEDASQPINDQIQLIHYKIKGGLFYAFSGGRPSYNITEP